MIGILGAGRLGMVLARLVAEAGHEVLIAGSADPARIVLPVDLPVDAVSVTTSSDAAERSDVVILALPLGRYRTVPADALAGKLVIDATNYWWEVDGFPAEFTDPLVSSSELVRAHLSSSRVVKAFNHMSYADLRDEARPRGHADRKAIGLAGDDADDLRAVSAIIDALGFDPVVVGALADGIRLEPGTEPFGADVDAARLRDMIARFPDSQRGRRRAAALAARAAPERG